MQKYVCLVICLISLSKVFPQSTFQYIYSSPHHEISRSLIEDNDANVYFSVENYQYGLIIKLDQYGSFLDSLRLDNHNGTCNLSELIKIDNDQFIGFGNWTSDTISDLWYLKFDNNLQVIEDKKLNSYGCFVFEFHHIINVMGNIVLIAHYQTSPNREMDVCMYEISQEGQVIRSQFFNASVSYNHAYTLLQNNFDQTYKVFAKSPLVSLSSRMPCIINLVDTSFNFINASIIQYPHIENNSCAKWLNDSIYFLAGKWLYIDQPEWDVGIVKVTLNDSIIASNSFGKPDTVDNPGDYHCLDFLTPDNIFFGWTSNSYLYPFQNEPSWIMLSILDSNLNPKYQTCFGGDAFYIVNSILAAQDSGCLISCSRYDWLTQYNQWDVYILKVNKDGLLVSTPENSIINRSVCFLYPNPGNEVLRINSPKNGLKFQLFDLAGWPHQSSQLFIGSNVISVSELPCGIYLYRIVDRRGNMIQSGKWIRR